MPVFRSPSATISPHLCYTKTNYTPQNFCTWPVSECEVSEILNCPNK